ncbi:DNA-binding CsgD family transcriptional regulator [Streptomyces umbrinus]|uniref:DNA-binding CsgD family transcriptional regulator n=1 Tax=Streptomyces umbrinus TaxID=67370 RepID=A0ABU0SNB5_9ACTN|nr:helix-turn-helix transcriptional regulator [Streptomyces umbrinus]MDQ1025050.1 DNA-binding CsgD family transcriptional regulator [Streptomyces umbrinus]
MTLGSADRTPVAELAHRVSDVCGRETSVRRVACRPDEAGTEHAVLRRLLDDHGAEPLPPNQVRHAAVARVNGLLAQAPLVLTLTDAQWCDDGTLRCIDHLMRDTSGEPLTVLLSLSPSALPAAAGAWHELVARDYCTVADVADLWPGDNGGPAGAGLDDLVRHESHLLRVSRASVLLRSADADLVGALAGLPAGVVARTLNAARELGLLPQRIPAHGVPPHLDALIGTLPAAEGERMRAQAAEILNDAGRPAGQVADLILGQSALNRPWMTAILKEAAGTARRDHPASAVRYLERLHRDDPADVAVRTDLAVVLLDIDPTAAREHLEGALARTDDPHARARAAVPLRLAALMTHRTPDTPRTLDNLLREVWAGRLDPTPPPRTRPTPVGGTTEHLALAARALRTALTGTDLRGATTIAQQVLRVDRPRTAWARVAAAQVLGLADDTTAALGHLDMAIADSERRKEVWADCHARSARALLLLESGRAHDAAEAALAASRIARGHGWEEHSHLAPVTLALALVAGADLDRAEDTLRRLDGRRVDDSVWAYHHHLMAKALVERGRGRLGQALDLMERCGASLAAADVANPVFTTWWVHSTELLMALGRTSAAAERAELGRHLAEQWPTARSTGLSVLARGMVAAASDRVELLAESVRLLDSSSDRYSRALAELRLGQALLQRGDKKAARGHLHAARATAVRYGLTTVAEPARAALTAAGGRPARVALSAAERPVAEMAAAGARNRAIADALYLTVRTVEYHLTNVYRKLGVTGRADLAEWLTSQSPGTSARVLGEDR